MLLAAASVALATPALARRNGIAVSSCEGCHGSAGSAEVELSVTPAELMPGATGTFTVTLRGSGAMSGGVFVADPGLGQLSTLAGEGLTLSAAGLTHSAPKAAQGGSISFRFAWTAPSTAGSVAFPVMALAANGDGRSSGDVPGDRVVSFVYGCTPQTFYFDGDGDGVGATRAEPMLGCPGAPPAGYVETSDDCDDSYSNVHPGAPELCNEKDDDCDGEIDEGSDPVELYPDPDGDGFHDRTGTPVVGCLPLTGYAAEGGDCAPTVADRNPGAEEICNLYDDNCDGRVDERVRPQCGEGWCRREAITCDVASCTPGEPVAERCNLIDDDCNGDTDDGEICASGEACLAGACVPLEPPAGGGAGGVPASGGNAALGGVPGAGGTPGGSTSQGGAPPSSGGRSTASSGGSASPGGAPPAAGGFAANGGTPGAPPGAPPRDVPGSGREPKAESGCAAARGGAPSAPLGVLLGLGWLVRRRLRARPTASADQRSR